MKFITRTIGRFLFAIPFLIFGLNHLIFTGKIGGFVPSWMPGAAFWTILTGLALIAASISMMIRVWDKWASFLLGIMLFIFVIVLHIPAMAAGDQSAMFSLLKDTALGGAAWLYSGYVAKN